MVRKKELTESRHVRMTYELSAFLLPGLEFLNLGYAPDDLDSLAEPERPDKFPAELYRRTLGRVGLTGADILEAGSGRGAGASLITREFRPRSYVGIDLSPGNVAIASKRYANIASMSFQCGDVQRLPFADRSFDVVINVESSHHYEDRARFFAEVGRVLVPGGWFLSAHFFEAGYDISADIVRGGMEIAEREDITGNVLQAMSLDSPLRKAFVEREVPESNRELYEAMVGTEDTDTYRMLQDGRFFYHIIRAQRAFGELDP